MAPLVLASASPRRAALLAADGIAFRVVVPEVDETPPPGVGPAEVARRLALAKALAVAARESAAALVLAADTIVVAPSGDLLGKARDDAEAEAMHACLAGRPHEVVTGVALHDAPLGRTRLAAVRSVVIMKDARALAAYRATGLWRGKAGAYGIQDRPSPVAAVEGSETNVVGLPMEAVRALLLEAMG
jgi:septum formation protein